VLRLMQRVCWNTRGWQLPSGSTNERGFPGENGFGHEEWNFQLSDKWKEFIFPYTYLVPQQKILDKNKGVFSVGFFTRHQERNEWLFLGIHHNAELIRDDEYPKIISAFTKNGIFDRRAEELLSVTNRFKTKNAALREVIGSFKKKYIRVKSPVSEIEVFPQPIVIEKPSNHRFKSFTYVDSFPSKLTIKRKSRQLRSALAEDGYYRELSSKLKIIIPRHNKLSVDFCAWLKKRGVSAKQEENYIDVLFEIKRTHYIAELKVVYGVGTTKAIREALGQLLEYNYYPGREAKKQWMIILDQAPVKTDYDYIDKLIQELNLPLRVGWRSNQEFEFYPEWRI